MSFRHPEDFLIENRRDQMVHDLAQHAIDRTDLKEICAYYYDAQVKFFESMTTHQLEELQSNLSNEQPTEELVKEMSTIHL